MRIAVASLGDPSSVDTWSGIPANIILALKKKGHEIQSIALDRPKEPWHFSWLRRYYFRIKNKWFLGAVEEQWLKKISEQLDEKVNRLEPEVVLVIHGDWLAYSTFKFPACIIHDTTFASIVDYYPSFTNLSDRSLRMGNQMYQRALNKSMAAVFSAHWATHSAITKYGSPESKVFTIPFGANMGHLPSESEVSQWINSRSLRESCNLVFIGTHWKRKGGPESLRFVSCLNKMGIRTHLTIIGCSPDIPSEMKEVVSVVGYLKKDEPSDRAKLNNILSESHALILPSQAECYGCVYCEANAYGLPALGRDTGGVPEIIKDGINGLLLKSGDSIDDFASRWADIWRDRSGYTSMSRNSYSEFRQRLNYDVFANKLENVLTNLALNNNN